MNIIRCSKGHFFDKDTFDECPHCRVIANRKGTPSSYSYGDFSRNTGRQDKKKKDDSPDEPVTGKMEYGSIPDEPVTGKMEYDSTPDEPVTGKVEYDSTPDGPVTGKMEYDSTPDEPVTGKIDHGSSPDESITGEIASAIPKESASEESEHTFRIEALDLDSFVELTASPLGRAPADQGISPAAEDQEPLFEELTEEDWRRESARFSEEKETGEKKMEEAPCHEAVDVEAPLKTAETSEASEAAKTPEASETPEAPETPAAPVIGKAAQTVQDLQDLPVGWLVCGEGPAAGAVFILRYGRSSIGRAASMTISLPGDTSLSNMNHAFVEYDAGGKQFYALPGTSRGLCYVADQLVLTRTPVNNYEKISLGESELMLVQLCGDHFDWDLSLR